MLNISLASLGLWNGTMDRNNKKKQNAKGGQEIESTVSTNKKVVKLRVQWYAQMLHIDGITI